MIGWFILICVGVLPALFVWLHMHHSSKRRELDDRIMSDIGDIWRDARELESKLTHKIESK